MGFNGNSGYAGPGMSCSVTGAEKPPAASLATWFLPVTVWHRSPTTFGNG